MKHSSIYHIVLFVASMAALNACSSKEVPSDAEQTTGDPIVVGVDAQGLEVSSVVTKAAGETTDAEKVSWLIQPLRQGMDITYGNLSSDGSTKQNERVAILKLAWDDAHSTYKKDATSGYAEYSFCYRDSNTGAVTDTKAKWYGNGLHYFEGVHVPYRIRYQTDTTELKNDSRTVWSETNLAKVASFTTNQSGDTSTGTDNQLGNYTLLEHYLGMPANTQLSATVARIKLPFRHRLSRVIAYILIDPTLKTNSAQAKIKGYSLTNGKDDPNTSSIRFCNVDMLAGVKDVYNSSTQLHTLTPTWAEKVRKVVPHFVEEISSILAYEKDDKTVYPNSTGYTEIHNAANHLGYTAVTYTAVPVYDLIVRPTYTSSKTVMYDEAGYSDDETVLKNLASKTNKIDFTVSLDNGLTYEKSFEFDLDANYQTIVYLKISRVGVDYNESGSALWETTSTKDDWYGVNNTNGNTLSKAGSSWQRAFYNCDLSGDTVTDGGFYDEDSAGEDGTSGQYLTDETWKKAFLQAYEGGAHHGDYFVLAKDIEIDARTIPENFVFTGHIDAYNTQGTLGYHTITLTNTGEMATTYIETTDYSKDVSEYYYASGSTYEHFSWPSYTLYILEEHKYTAAEAIEYNANLPGAVKTGDVQTPAVLYANVDEYNTAKGTSLTEEEFAQLSDDEKIKTPAVLYTAETAAAYNATLPGAKTTDDTYTMFVEVNSPSIQDAKAGKYYRCTDIDEYSQYSLPTLYLEHSYTSASSLFTGLNGIYTTNQENGMTPWEANVHKEGSYWIPYTDGSTGWRAEVMNLTVAGGSLFKAEAVITGNVQNCKDANGDVADHTPAYPKYK